MTGVRKTFLKPLIEGTQEVVIEDNYKTVDEPQRLLQERWTGETHFEIKPEHVTKALKKHKELEKKRPLPAEEPGFQEDQAPGIQEPSQPSASPREVDDEGDVVFPEQTDLTAALRGKGANAVDGVPDIPSQLDDSNNRCPGSRMRTTWWPL